MKGDDELVQDVLFVLTVAILPVPHTLTDRHAVKDRIDPFGNVLLARWTSNCAAGCAGPMTPG